MPLCHILIHLILNYSYVNNSEIFEEIAKECHELRMLPLPFGVLPHELIEIIDNERILPGISYLYKLGEDFPLLNHYNFTNIETKDDTAENINW